MAGLRSSEPGAFEAGRFHPGRLPQKGLGEPTVPAYVEEPLAGGCETGNAPVEERVCPMGKPKGRVRRGRQSPPRVPKRTRLGAKRRVLVENRRKKALGIRPDDILPHIVGRRRWHGMRDYAPQENGPVRIRKVEP